MMEKITPAAALALAILFVSAGAACAQPSSKPAAEAVKAPDFTITDLGGTARTLGSYKGKVLVINFWATWCPPCRREIPDFISAYKDLQAEGLEILGLSVDDMTAATLLEWVRKNDMNYPVALATPEIIAAYEPGDFIPATIIVDREGRIRFRKSELMSKETLVRLFNEYK